MTNDSNEPCHARLHCAIWHAVRRQVACWPFLGSSLEKNNQGYQFSKSITGHYESKQAIALSASQVSFQLQQSHPRFGTTAHKQPTYGSCNWNWWHMIKVLIKVKAVAIIIFKYMYNIFECLYWNSKPLNVSNQVPINRSFPFDMLMMLGTTAAGSNTTGS